MNKMIRLIAFLFVFSLISCVSKNQEDIFKSLEPCDITGVSFATDVKPVLDQYCATSGCHNAQSNAQSINLETFATLQTVAMQPRFLGSIKHSSGYVKMPLGSSKLDNCTIQKIETWVNQGAQNN